MQGWATLERLFTYEKGHAEINGVISADENFFDIFAFRGLRGNVEAALAAPNQVILTASTARRLFGEDAPIGQTLYFNAATPYTVAALVADPPPNTHLPFNVLLSHSDTRQRATFVTCISSEQPACSSFS